MNRPRPKKPTSSNANPKRNDRRDRNRRSGDRDRNRKPKRPSHRISEHFSKRDFTCKCGDCKQTIKISLGLVGALEMLRFTSKNRINIKKGYECPESKEKSGSFKRNYHAIGIAVTITVDSMDPKDVFLLCEEIEEIKGLGLNLQDNFVYLDTRKEDERTTWIVDESGKETSLTEKNRSKLLGSD